MAVVLDAAAHPVSERSDLVSETIASSGARRRVALNAPPELVTLRAESWQLGRTQVLRTSGTGLTLTRTRRDVQKDAPELLAIALSGGESTYAACGRTQELGPNGVLVVDFRTPYRFSHRGREGRSFTTHISYDDLGLSVDVVRAAIPRLDMSPLLPVVRGHLMQVSSVITRVTDDRAVAADLAAATVELTRALIVSAAADRKPPPAPREALRAGVVAYIEDHLGDRDLTPSRIAAAHLVSLRTLYNVWGDHDVTLVEWIVRRRLERVRDELVPGANIFATARRWGFVDPAHFGRRFRAAYGASPSEWLRRPVDP